MLAELRATEGKLTEAVAAYDRALELGGENKKFAKRWRRRRDDLQRNLTRPPPTPKPPKPPTGGSKPPKPGEKPPPEKDPWGVEEF